MKFVDDDAIISWISKSENSYQEEINNIVGWYTENNLLLNVKIKELIVDFFLKGDNPVVEWGEQF